MKPEDIAALIRETARTGDQGKPDEPKVINGPVPYGYSKPEKQKEFSQNQIPPSPVSPHLGDPENFAAKNFGEVNGSPTKVLPVNNATLCEKYDSCLDVPFLDIFKWWEEKTDKYKNLPLVRALCMYDRYFLLVQMFGRQDMLHEWLYERCREVEREPDNCLDLWSRFHYKSTIITYAGVIQEILKDPELTVGIFSHVKPIAKAFLSQIKRELESNEQLKKLFPDILFDNPERQSPSWSVDNGLIVKRKGNPKEPTISAWGLVDGQPVSAHYRLRVYALDGRDSMVLRGYLRRDHEEEDGQGSSLSSHGRWDVYR